MKKMKVMEVGARIEDSEGIQVDFANKCVPSKYSNFETCLKPILTWPWRLILFSGKLVAVCLAKAVFKRKSDSSPVPN